MFVVGLMKMEVNGYFYHYQNVQVCIQLYSILIYVFASLVFSCMIEPWNILWPGPMEAFR